MSKVVRSVKNVTKGYSAVEIKVRNATSNDPWGPVGSDMAEIAKMTFNSNTDFYQIMDMLDKRLNDKGKNWRHVLKSLKVLDYCLHEGSELVVTWARKNVYIIKTLREFQYIDEEGRDVGQNIRVAAKELTALILDEERLRAERQDRKSWKSRVTGIEEFGPQHQEATRPQQKHRNRRQNDEDDLEFKLALEASKNEAEEDKRRRERLAHTEDDEDLAKALKLSKEEEELRRKQLEDQNAQSLLDDTPAQQVPQPTGWNQGYQQQGTVDWFGNLIDQQPQNTGFLNNAYSQQQPTGMNGVGFGYPQQVQQTGFDQFGQQPNFVPAQQTAFNMNNPYGQQQLPQQLEQQSTLQPGNHNPWASNQPITLDSVKPQPTGSNNPFASSFNRPQLQQSSAPTLGVIQEQKTQTQFNNQNFNPPISFSAPHPAQQKPQNPHHERLNALLSSGEGQDTFGNVGELRIPAQHTAPGTFVNSAGAGASRLTANATGTNPFLHSQFTGMPQTRLVPAQTGPAGAFGAVGYGGNNPFGRAQQNNQQPQTGSLIDL